MLLSFQREDAALRASTDAARARLNVSRTTTGVGIVPAKSAATAIAINVDSLIATTPCKAGTVTSYRRANRLCC